MPNCSSHSCLPAAVPFTCLKPAPTSCSLSRHISLFIWFRLAYLLINRPVRSIFCPACYVCIRTFLLIPATFIIVWSVYSGYLGFPIVNVTDLSHAMWLYTYCQNACSVLHMVSSKRWLVMSLPGLAEILAAYQLYSVARQSLLQVLCLSKLPWCLQMPAEYFAVLLQCLPAPAWCLAVYFLARSPMMPCCQVLKLLLPATCYMFAWCMPESGLFLCFADVLPDYRFCVLSSCDSYPPPDCDTSSPQCLSKMIKLIFCSFLCLLCTRYTL